MPMVQPPLKTVVAIYITCLNIEMYLHSAHTVYLCISYDCHNKQHSVVGLGNGDAMCSL
jgi:hypothetical protein